MARATGRLRLRIRPGLAVVLEWTSSTGADGGTVSLSGGSRAQRRALEEVLAEPASVYVPRLGGSVGDILPNVWEWTRERAGAAVRRRATPFRDLEVLEEPVGLDDEDDEDDDELEVDRDRDRVLY